MKLGIIGDATKATSRKGEVILELLVNEIGQVVRQLGKPEGLKDR